MPICGSCGKNYENTFKFCPNCGRAAPERGRVSNLIQENQSILACPKCHKDDNVAKVSAILQRDTHQSQIRVPVTTIHSGDNGEISSSTYWENVSSTQTSNLAKTLLPPPPPIKSEWGETSSSISLAVFGISLIVLACAPCIAALPMFGVLSQTTTKEERGMAILAIIGATLLSIFLLLVFGAVSYYFVSKSSKYHKDYPSHRMLWEESMNRYNQLYYCFRDDNIFIPGEDTYVSPSNIMEYIKWRPYSSKLPF